MKRNLQSLFIAALVLMASTMQAQVRYLDEVFTDAQIQETDSVVYAQNYEYYTTFASLQPLVMDVFQPAGDTATMRPLILLSHDGSFLPESFTHAISGTCFNGRKDSGVVELCKRFAKRGYVAVSFDYRLGWNPQGDQIARTKTIIQAVYRAMQDAKALIRFFKNDYATTNTWKIDTGRIVLGGSNSGAYVALAASSLNDTSELNNLKFVDIHGSFIKQDTLGDFDGFGGVQNYGNYPGISSRFEAVLTVGGAVGDTSWIAPGETPILAFHGVSESNTPYNTDIVKTGGGTIPIIEVSGPGDFMPFVDRANNNHAFKRNPAFAPGPANRNGQNQITTPIEGLYPFYNEKFEPWDWWDTSCYNNSASMQALTTDINGVKASKSKAMLYIDTIMDYSMPRLYKLFYQYVVGVNEANREVQIGLYPNPASSNLTVSADQEIANIQLFDVTGRLAKEVSNVNANWKNISLSGINNGVYLVTLKLTDGTSATRRLFIGN